MPAGISSERSASTPEALLRVPRRLAAGGAQLALLLAIVALVGLGLLPRTGWYRPVTVLSGSMRPAFAPGDMVVVTPEPVASVRVGQVISYRIPVGDHHVQSHRVIAVTRRGGEISVRTKGDANDAPDPWTATLHGTTVWQVRAVLPKLGWAVFWLRTPLAHGLTVLLAPLLLALLVVLQIWRRPGEGALEGHDAARTPAA
ncbi:MAG TPA: signal peptidase I [Gaiellaceae bacterium]|nr:signal peptidase I [Gaiellaceae bacterium]